MVILLFITTNCNRLMFNRIHYKKLDTYSYSKTSKGFILEQHKTYGIRNATDSHITYVLKIMIKDSLKAFESRVLNIKRDTSLIEIKFDIRSVWNEGQNSISTSGEIELLNWETEGVTIRQNITIKELDNKKIYRYKGVKRFQRVQ